MGLITPFSGDETNSEADLTTFLREIYNVSQTNNLNESTTINILVRKLTGTAQILVDDFIAQNDRQNMRLKQVVAHLERKFLMVSGYLWLSRVISGYLRLSQAISGYLGLTQAISGY